MKKLLTSGCSYTDYYYPTWAAWLGQNFEQYQNLAIEGTGPRYSYTVINDYFKYKKCNPKEHIVIVQWSSLLRHDIRKSTEFDWVLGGQIDNNEYYDELYLEKYYNSIDVASDLVKYIDHLILLSKKLGFKLLMTYMFEPWIDNYLGEPVSSTEIVRRNIKDLKNSKYLKSLEEFTKTEYWINP